MVGPDPGRQRRKRNWAPREIGAAIAPEAKLWQGEEDKKAEWVWGEEGILMEILPNRSSHWWILS